MTKRPFDGFNFDGFWNDCPYSLENYVEPPPSDELIASIEQKKWAGIVCRRPMSTSHVATMAEWSSATAIQ